MTASCSALPAPAPTSDTVSYRVDALDRVNRAAEAKEDKALNQLDDDAKLSGDTMLVKAILGHAYCTGNVDVDVDVDVDVVNL